jgi:hypothetical protein
MNLQTRYDLELQKDRLGDRLEREIRVFAKSGCSRGALCFVGWHESVCAKEPEGREGSCGEENIMHLPF